MNKKMTLSQYEELARQRIKHLIDVYCDGSQQVFAERSGLNKASVSQYMNGKNAPSTKTAEKIAAAFGCDPQWVMGFSASKHYTEEDDERPYYDDGTLEVAQELFDNVDMRLLFDAARDCKPEDLKMAADLLKRLKATNPDG